ncbi:MAG: UvrD-helicase domain-containing protein, partial [Desulfobacterales bacterium]|nr:UvrD-helicase domain-containing protein [Desulfobacterales bacterium]
MKGIKVAIASDFLTSFAKIPASRRNKVLQFVNKFRANPTSPKINYEKIVGAKDKNMRSVRIDKVYRGVMLKPGSGNVYLLLRVDHHDKAYAWAANRTCKIHPETGSLQVINVEEAAPDKTPAPPEPAPTLFARFRDRQLTRLGVPGELMAAVRRIRDKEELDRCSERFPREVYEALYFLSEEIPYEEVIRDLEEFAPVPERVDTEDFDAALDAADSKRRFHVVEEENELMEILNEPLEKWRVFLHPSQRYLALKPWKGPFRVLGGAGTGKTVVAMHRAKWLAGTRFTGEHDRILFTTFTRNLAADIRANLLKICSREEMA